jgi:murein DD-endopeptidase MepM/ murein hydrolase activator NlpD
LSREQDRRPRKTPARKTATDGAEERSGNTGDTGREQFNLRSGRREDTPGGSAPRDAPVSVREAISRHNRAQTRKFTEHAAKDERAADTGAVAPAPEETAQPDRERLSHDSAYSQRFEENRSGILKTDGRTRHSGTPSQNATGSGSPDASGAAERYRRGSAYRRRFEEPRADRPDTRKTADAPPAEHAADADRPPEQPQEIISDGESPARDAPPHDRAPRSGPERPGRLHRDRASAAPKEPKRRPPPSNAAKHMPPKEANPDAAAPAGTGTDKKETDGQAAARETAQDSGASSAKSAPDRGAERRRTGKPGRLRFSGEESAPPPENPARDRKSEKTAHKAERSAGKTEKTRQNPPKKRKPGARTAFDEKRGKPMRKLLFEVEANSLHRRPKGPQVMRPVKAAAGNAGRFAHSKVFEEEQENVGAKAAHRAEMSVGGGLRTAYRLHRTATCRKVEKSARGTVKLSMKASYRQALHDNPGPESNIFPRPAQKRRIKRRYAKAAREAKKVGGNPKKSGDVLTKAGRAAVRLAKRHPLPFGIIGGLFLLTVIISSLFTFFSNMGSGVGGAVTAASYLAGDADIDNAEILYTELETDLRMQIGGAESSHPGYDEYRYRTDNIGHNPYELMAFLTAVYREFTYSGVEAILRQLFAEQYRLTFTPSAETRYADPRDADGDGDTEPYDWRILTVTLTSRPFTEVIRPRMDTDRRRHYDLLTQTKGARQYVGSPFDFNRLPYISSGYGYRVHPISGAKNLHRGIDIAAAQGTEIRAAHAGTAGVGCDPDGFGNYAVITGTDGLVTKYAHCHTILVGDGQAVNAGDVIATVGSTGTGTGPHLHFEVIKNGQYLNPAYFSKTNGAGSLRN